MKCLKIGTHTDSDIQIVSTISLLELNTQFTRLIGHYSKIRAVCYFQKKSKDELVVLKELILRRPEIKQAIIYIEKVTQISQAVIRSFSKNPFLKVMVIYNSPQRVSGDIYCKDANRGFYNFLFH